MATGQPELYEEIDLRPYIEALLRSWYWILGIAIVAAVVTFGVMSLPAPQYQATALVAITRPRFDVQFDPRLQTIEDVGIGYGAYEEIAMSDELLEELFVSLSTVPSGIDTLGEFKQRMLSVEIGENETLISLHVISTDSALATEASNKWAKLVIDRSNEIYGNSSEDSVLFLETQVEVAEGALVEAEDALVSFEARNPTLILSNQLNDLVNRQQKYLNQQSKIDDLLRDIGAFRDLLSRGDDSVSLSQADQLTALSIQSRVFNTDLDNIQLDVSNGFDLLSSDRQQVIVSLDDLFIMLEERRDLYDQLLVDLSPQILALQSDLSALSNELNRLESELRNARDAKDLFVTSLEETRISSQEVSNQVKIAAEAVEPQEPLPQNRAIATLIASILVCFGTLGFLFAREWWKQRSTL